MALSVFCFFLCEGGKELYTEEVGGSPRSSWTLFPVNWALVVSVVVLCAPGHHWVSSWFY